MVAKGELTILFSGVHMEDYYDIFGQLVRIKDPNCLLLLSRSFRPATTMSSVSPTAEDAVTAKHLEDTADDAQAAEGEEHG